MSGSVAKEAMGAQSSESRERKGESEFLSSPPRGELDITAVLTYCLLIKFLHVNGALLLANLRFRSATWSIGVSRYPR